MFNDNNVEAATWGVLWEKVFLAILQNSQENTCARVTFFKKETLAQSLSCEFWEISKNILFTEHLCTIASEQYYVFRVSSRCTSPGHLASFKDISNVRAIVNWNSFRRLDSNHNESKYKREEAAINNYHKQIW